jgi:phage terminase large subunit
MNAPAFDFLDPDYSRVFAERVERLQRIRADRTGQLLLHLRAFYRENPWQFIEDWGCTFDPRLIRRKLPAVVPFILFPKQREWCQWVVARWHAQEPGINDKSRDMGVTWLAIGLSVTLCLFYEGMAIGFGSRKEEYVDKLGSPKSIFWKGREFIRLLPPEFRPGWSPTDAPHMRLSFPATQSVIAGEAGDNIGRGDRASIYFVDESAFLERPQLIEASLSQTTDCRIDVSTPHGMNNPFAIKRHSWPPERIFTMHWRDDPRKGEEWYARQVENLDEVTLAQEVDLDYSASVFGVIIPRKWVNSAIDAHAKLGIEITGPRRGALDVADEGPDLNAFAVGRGIYLENVTAWSGKGSDTFATAQRSFAMADVLGIEDWWFDSDGLGAGIRGDARVINEERKRKQDVRPWRGSGEVVDKDKPIETAAPRSEKRDPHSVERLNGDYYMNANSQAAFSLRARFQRTHRAVEMAEAGEDWRAAYDEDSLISINGKMPELTQVVSQLSQPTYTQSTTGKMQIEKKPQKPGEPRMRSPNHFDAIKILFAPKKRGRRYRLEAFSE